MRSRILLLTWLLFFAAIVGASYFFARSKPPSPPMVKSVAPEIVVPAKSVSVDSSLFSATNAASAETALAIGEQFLAADPTDEDRRASDLLVALCNANRFQTAIALANRAPADLRDNWLKLIFTRWTQTNPQNAMAALDSISNSAARTLAFQTAADTWVANKPSSLADFAASLPNGDDKTYALEQVVDNWSLQDPAALAAWLNTSPAGVDTDLAIAEMISKTDDANRPPRTAAQWVEKISDPALKYNSLLHVLSQWSQSDAPAAENYLSNVSWLDEQQKQEMLAKIKTPPADVAGGGE